MKENAIERINKLGKVGRILARIINVCLIIGFVGVLIGEIVMLVLPADLYRITVNQSVELKVDNSSLIKLSNYKFTESELVNRLDAKKGYGGLEIDNVDYKLTGLNVENGYTYITGDAEDDVYISVVRVRIVLALAMVIIASSYVLSLFVIKLSSAIETCETPFCDEVINSLSRFALSLIVYVLVSSSLGSIASSLFAGMATTSVHIDLTAGLVAIAIYALTLIFKYGACLQQESDETL